MTNETVATLSKTVGRFGIGCLQFRPKNTSTKFSNFRDYTDRVKKSLGQISAIQDIELHFDDGLHAFDNGMPTPFSLLSNSEYPDLTGAIFFHLTLKLMIPERTQREILDEHGNRFTPVGEIVTHISYQYDMPSMIVLLPGKGHETNPTPSSCIVLVREFLRSEMEKNPNCEFTIDLLGPSPFHADFTLMESPSVTQELTWERTDHRGYDEITISIPTGLSTLREIFWHIDEHLLDDFDIFYLIAFERSKIMKEWHACLESITAFKAKTESRSAVRRMVAWVLPTSQTYDLASQIADFRLTTMTALDVINQRISESAFIQKSAIWRDVETGNKTFPRYDVDSLEKLIDFIERQQAHKQNVANAIVAAVAGGAAGGVAAWLLQTPM